MFYMFFVLEKNNLKQKAPMTMTMTTTAAQELLRRDAEIEARAVGGRMCEAFATSVHLYSFFFVRLWSVGRTFNVHSLIRTKSFTHALNPILENPFETIHF